MTSSMSGMVLDNFVLTKPAGWQPDVTGRTAYLDDVFVSNYTGSTIVEVDGAPFSLVNLLLIPCKVELQIEQYTEVWHMLLLF